MKIGIIGFGNMGSAIAEGIKSKFEVLVFDKDKEKTKNSKGIIVAKNIGNLVDLSDVIILAVKPQDIDNVLSEIKDFIVGKLLISILAGIETKYIEDRLSNVRMVRAMPSIGVRINKSVTFLCDGKFATAQDSIFVRDLFSRLGKTLNIKEELMNAATAIFGSGPAYFCYDLESKSIDHRNIPEEVKKNDIQKMADAASEIGFNSKDALSLSVDSITSTVDLLKNTDPASLRKQITSKGGTTEAALEVLYKGKTWTEAAKAALERAKKLSRS